MAWYDSDVSTPEEDRMDDIFCTTWIVVVWLLIGSCTVMEFRKSHAAAQEESKAHWEKKQACKLTQCEDVKWY